MTDPKTDASEWPAVGDHVLTVRRLGRSVAWQAEVVVVRRTAASVFATLVDGQSMFRFSRNKHGQYVAVPAYLDYVETLEPLPSDAPATT